jgi:hypothetical protein
MSPESDFIIHAIAGLNIDGGHCGSVSKIRPRLIEGAGEVMIYFIRNLVATWF